MTQDAATAEAVQDRQSGRGSLIPYFLVGCYLGIVFIKSEVASWFRIQEMFRFQAIHMYGVIGGAVLVAALGTWLLKRTRARTVFGEEIAFPEPSEGRPSTQHILGGVCFGLGWGLTGACPGPIYALIGSGLPIMLVALVGALAGAWVYGLLRPRLPH
ncbi:MAG: YeeE/YedE thiosulfate transporter family protein [Gemmatimonadota bacterium]|jgi:uncharacterized membrane protein YedE/YeeE